MVVSHGQDFALNLSPAGGNAITVPNGGGATLNLSTVGLNGFNGTIAVFVSQAPGGSNCSFSTGGGRSHSVWAALTTESNPAGTFTINGQTQQPNGLGISGSTLEARDSQNNVVASGVRSDAYGNYSIVGLSSGQYTVTASSPYGIFAPESETYSLTSAPGLTKNRRLMTMLAEPDTITGDHCCLPKPVHLTIGTTTTTYWYYPRANMPARNIVNPPGCWASRPNDISPTPASDVHITLTLPTDTSQNFTATITVDPNATPGSREFYCRYAYPDGNVADLDGADFLELDPPPSCTTVTPPMRTVDQSTPPASLLYTINGVADATSVRVKVFSASNPSSITTYSASSQLGSWIVSFGSSALTDLGLYTVQPVVSDGTVETQCSPAYITVTKIVHQDQQRQGCGGVEGTSVSDSATYNLIQGTAATNGAAPISGSATTRDSTCADTFSISGSYTPSNGAFALDLRHTGTAPACPNTIHFDGITSDCLHVTVTTSSGSGQLTWNRQSCTLPTQEAQIVSAQPWTTPTGPDLGAGWDDIEGLAFTQMFSATVSNTSDTSFRGRGVLETDAGGGTDTCHREGSAAAAVISILGLGGWFVTAGNQYGWDQIGPFPDWIAYVRKYRPAGSSWPCAITLQQNMLMQCSPGASSSYLAQPNTLQVSLDTTSETVKRGSATATRNK